MATAIVKKRCIICGKEKASFKCEGCSQTFCYTHVADHRQELSKQLDEIEVTRDLFRHTLTEQTAESRRHPLIQQIDKWERTSINKIRQTADEARQLLLRHTTDHVAKIEVKLAELTDQLRRNRQENDFVETDLNYWKAELIRLTEELTEPPNVSIRQDTTPLVTNIFVDVPSLLKSTNIGINARWMQHGLTVAGGNGPGNKLNQLFFSWGLYVDDDQTVYIADRANDRIMEWRCGATRGQIVAGGNRSGNRADQLNRPVDVIVDKKSDSLIICDDKNRRVVRWPRQNGAAGQAIISDIDCSGLAIDNDGYLYISDHQQNNVRRFTKAGTNGAVVAGGNGKGGRLDQLSYPTYIFVDQDHSVYVSDTGNHRVVKWMKGAKEGIVVAGGQNAGNGLQQLAGPYGISVDELGTVYVADSDNHRVVRWLTGGTQGSIIVGGQGRGATTDQLSRLVSLSFDREGNLYVVDGDNNRVQKFNIQPNSN